MKDTKSAGATLPDLVKPDEVQTSALAKARQQDPAVGGSYIRKVSTGEVVKRPPVREQNAQE